MVGPSPVRKMWSAMPLADASADGVGAVRAGFGQDQRELVAAEPRHDVRFPRAARMTAAASTSARLPEQVAVGVVDRFEPVQVDEQQRERPAAAHRALGFPAQRLVQVARVVELRQVVGDRQRLGAPSCSALSSATPPARAASEWPAATAGRQPRLRADDGSGSSADERRRCGDLGTLSGKATTVPQPPRPRCGRRAKIWPSGTSSPSCITQLATGRAARPEVRRRARARREPTAGRSWLGGHHAPRTARNPRRGPLDDRTGRRSPGSSVALTAAHDVEQRVPALDAGSRSGALNGCEAGRRGRGRWHR